MSGVDHVELGLHPPVLLARAIGCAGRHGRTIAHAGLCLPRSCRTPTGSTSAQSAQIGIGDENSEKPLADAVARDHSVKTAQRARSRSTLRTRSSREGGEGGASWRFRLVLLWA